MRPLFFLFFFSIKKPQVRVAVHSSKDGHHFLGFVILCFEMKQRWKKEPLASTNNVNQDMRSIILFLKIFSFSNQLLHSIAPLYNYIIQNLILLIFIVPQLPRQAWACPLKEQPRGESLRPLLLWGTADKAEEKKKRKKKTLLSRVSITTIT